MSPVAVTRAVLVVALACAACSNDAQRPNPAQTEAVAPGRVVVGIGVRDLRPIDLPRVGGTELRGAYVGLVMPGSPAERVGVRVGDVVLEANRTPIMRAEELQRLIGMQRGGAVLELTIQRAGQLLRVSVQARQESGRIG